MKKLLIFLALFFTANLTFGRWTTTITVSESGAEIYVNGTQVGTAPYSIPIGTKECVQVQVKKNGFITVTRKYCLGVSGYPKPPKKEFITMIKDESYDASSSTDIVNMDIGITTTKTEDKAWKLISEVVTTYFDVIEVSDKSAGYIRTSWVVQSYNGSTIRTRVIIKASSSENSLKYKVKIICEKADGQNISPKEDENFKPWDRILKKYSNLLPELQSRLE